MKRLTPLHTKLLRDVWRLRAQSLAIALVIAAGVGMVIMSFGMIRSLEATRDAYYDRYRFADVFAPVRRAPESLMTKVRELPGVAVAESRITAAATLDVPGIVEPVSAHIHSLPRSGQPAMNRLVVRQGRLPDPRKPDEIVVNEAFAKATRLAPGDRLRAVLYGKQVDLQIVGTVLSPEYVYTVAPGQIFPDNRRFGILWMQREALASALNLTDSFNEVVIALEPGAQEPEVSRRLDLLLARYGGVGAFGRDQQISHRFVTNEIAQLRVTVEILPPIFLGVAAFLLNMVLARLVDTERDVIGLLKAFGYRDRAIMVHYGELALLLSLGGLVIGSIAGSWLGRQLALLYQDFFVFPFLEFRAGADVYLIALAACLAAMLVGAVAAVRRAARLTPAEAMRPPTPPDFSGRLTAAARVGPDESSRMILRSLLRRPVRSVLTMGGLAAALALYIASASATDNVDRMIDIVFGQSQRADLIVGFAEPRDARAIYELARAPGVIRVEPVRSVDAFVMAGHRREREGLTSIDTGSDLRRMVTVKGKIVEPPPTGVILSERLARQLGVKAGDWVEAQVTEGERPHLRLRIANVVDSPIGSSATMGRQELNRALREGNTISGAYLSVDKTQLPNFYATLKETPQVANVTIFSAMLQGLRDTIAESMGIVTLFNTGFAALIVLGVVYNSARISLSERARDLASMRVLGFRKGEVAFVLLGEQALLVLGALPFGIGLGVALARYVTARYSASGGEHTDLYTIPFGVTASTVAEGVLVVTAAAIGTAVLIRMRVDRLDLVRALKTRE